MVSGIGSLTDNFSAFDHFINEKCRWSTKSLGFILCRSPVNHRADINRETNHLHSYLHLWAIHVFGLWEEGGVPGENPRRHEENMQIPRRRAPAAGGPEPSCCEAPVLITVPRAAPLRTISWWDIFVWTSVVGGLTDSPTDSRSVSPAGRAQCPWTGR